MSLMRVLATHAKRRASASSILTRRENQFATNSAFCESGVWRFRRHGRMSGFAPPQMDTSRPLDTTRVGASKYRYHERWCEIHENKFERLADFAKALPNICRRVARDIQLPGLPRQKILATVVRLLERTFIRIGNEEYARDNKSFGLTTM